MDCRIFIASSWSFCQRIHTETSACKTYVDLIRSWSRDAFLSTLCFCLTGASYTRRIWCCFFVTRQSSICHFSPLFILRVILQVCRFSSWFILRVNSTGRLFLFVVYSTCLFYIFAVSVLHVNSTSLLFLFCVLILHLCCFCSTC